MDPRIYTPPQSEPDISALKMRQQGGRTALAGVLLFSGPLWGMLMTATGMIQAFNTLSEKDGVSAAEDRLSGDIGLALAGTAAGIVAGLFGAVLILTALFALRNRARWFLRWSLALALFWCVMLFPFGLIAGLPVLISFVVKRAEFAESSPASLHG